MQGSRKLLVTCYGPGIVARKENVLENDAEPSKGMDRSAHVLWISAVDSAPLQRSWGSRSRNAETPHHCATEIKVTLNMILKTYVIGKEEEYRLGALIHNKKLV